MPSDATTMPGPRGGSRFSFDDEHGCLPNSFGHVAEFLRGQLGEQFDKASTRWARSLLASPPLLLAPPSGLSFRKR